MADFLAKLHHALDLGTIVVTPSEGSLDGTRAVMRIGRVGKIGSPEALRYLLDSEDPPDEPAVFTWTQVEDSEAWNLRCALSGAIITAIGVGGWTWELSIVTTNDEQLWGESGTLRIAPSLPEDFDL